LNIGGDRWLGAIYSRGCPFKCSFCINSTTGTFNSHIRYHDIDHVINDIATLVQNYGADAITIHDDLFLFDEQRVNKFCHALLESKLDIYLRANGRVDIFCKIKDETLALMKRAGFINVIFGIESGSPRMLHRMKKNIKLDQILTVDSRLSKYGFYKHWNFMTAMPGETLEDVGHTLWLIAQLAKTSMNSPFPFSYRRYIPLPNTELFESAVKEYDWETPKSLEEWRDFSEAFLKERVGNLEKNIRPWISPELKAYVDRGEQFVDEMNSLFTGEDCDKNEIAKRVETLEQMALEALGGEAPFTVEIP